MRRIILTGLVCLIVGAVAGFFAARRSNANTLLHYQALSCAGTIARDRAILQALNSGNTTGAVQNLRSHLTIKTMMLGQFLDELPPPLHDTNLVGVLDHARRYQSNHFMEPDSPKKP